MAVGSWETVQREAAALVNGAAERGLTVRVVGSTGIRLHCPEACAAMDEVKRPANDIDVVVRHAHRGGLREWLETRGWVVDRDLLVALEGERFAFHHPDSGLDLDVFVERLEFCHTIELGDRWALHPVTVPIEELLLQKLQVHELTYCDLVDAAVVLATHDVAAGEDHEERIDCGYLVGVLASDWGFHRDATANLERVRRAVGRGGEVSLPDEGARRVQEGAALLLDATAASKKTLGWRMRARVGERLQWWEDVSEREDTY